MQRPSVSPSLVRRTQNRVKFELGPETPPDHRQRAYRQPVRAVFYCPMTFSCSVLPSSHDVQLPMDLPSGPLGQLIPLRSLSDDPRCGLVHVLTRLLWAETLCADVRIEGLPNIPSGGLGIADQARIGTHPAANSTCPTLK